MVKSVSVPKWRAVQSIQRDKLVYLAQTWPPNRSTTHHVSALISGALPRTGQPAGFARDIARGTEDHEVLLHGRDVRGAPESWTGGLRANDSQVQCGW